MLPKEAARRYNSPEGNVAREGVPYSHKGHTRMNQAFRKKVEKLELLMSELRCSRLRDWDDRTELPGGGVYVFYEKGLPLYVGRSRNLKRRITEHGAKSSRIESATFAFKLLRRKIGQPEGHDSPLTRKQIQDSYNDEYARQRERIRRMQFHVVEINDDEEQVLFELYASIALSTEYNSFRAT